MNTPDITEPRSALVTGATGFIGAHLMQLLLQQGWKVSALARRAPANTDCTLGATWHIHDGTYESVNRAVRESQPNIVFHLASRFIADHTPDEVDHLIDANLRLGMHILEAMHRNKVKRLVNAGSSWQHFNNAPYDPANLYAATKQAFEALITYYCNAHDFQVITLALYDTFGMGDKRRKVYNLLSDSIINRKPLDLTDGSQVLSLVHVSDVARGFLEAFNRLNSNQNKSRYEKFGLFSDKPVSLRELARIIQDRCNQTANLNWGALPHRERAVMSPASALPRLPNWAPTLYP